ncbi:hypothetical protein SAMN03159341_1076 [Paenibacillus sp. 1_12]|uniref:hypothetical protein n=1 Tax=Paenibacillus sp. 1_12 TaxID=1566278 RepID=UPI0008F1145A|nr:hypothetical protein [Paenibacillus sp. 1_12]SFL52936.1 hypothetical protein SAMN03159341_1076 [Paenibacillus sp. 1_12]
MNNRQKGLLGIIVIGLSINFWMIWWLQPYPNAVTNSFPLFAKSSSPANQIPNDGSSYTFQLKHMSYAQK